MSKVFFNNSGSEANESAVKLVWYYNNARGRHRKKKIIARQRGYHGTTMVAASLTGLAASHRDFDLPIPQVRHTDCPYFYRDGRPGESEEQFATRLAENLDAQIQREDPDTVAAFIAEPVMGAGGVIPPPAEYFPRVREVCDRHQVLFIADEVITGFGRTGKMFALDHWQVRPDVVSFAKGVTSAYIPLGGIMISKPLATWLGSLPPDQPWMHAYTYSGHAVACAVGLRNVEIIEREGLVQRAAEMGDRLLKGLRGLESLPMVGDVRGLGLMAAVEMVANKETREAYPAGARIAPRVLSAARERGVLFRNRGDVVMMAPPLVVSADQVDRMVAVLGESIRQVTAQV
jgi:4-aminobutyrate---pyruvate transaminase